MDLGLGKEWKGRFLAEKYPEEVNKWKEQKRINRTQTYPPELLVT